MRAISLCGGIFAAVLLVGFGCSNSSGGSADSSGGGRSAGGSRAGGGVTSAGGSQAPGGGSTGGSTVSGGSGTPGDSASTGGSAIGGASSTGGNATTGGGATTGGTSSGGTSSGGASSGVTVKLDAVHQTIQGFGINDALVSNPWGSKALDYLFGTSGDDAIGLTIMRIGMRDGEINGTNADNLAYAKSHNVRLIGSCWSPPAKCKSNGRTDQGGYLLNTGTCFADWAQKIVDFAKKQGLYAMSIGNESDFASCAAKGPPCTTDYETTTYTAKQMVEWVKFVGPKLQDAKIKVIAPEASEWIHAWSNISATGSTVSSHPNSSDPLNCSCYANAITADKEKTCTQTCLDGNGYDYGHWMWKDQVAWKAFDIFGVHEYDSQIAFAWPSDVNNGKPDHEVWQTEMSGVRYWPQEGPSTDISNGVAVAGWIHSALTVGEASAWLWWWYQAYDQNDNEGLALNKGVSTGSTPNKRYYVLGNYSKFVRPGYIAVEVGGNSNADVLLSAFKGTDAMVIVAVNKGSAAATVPIGFSGGAAPASCTPNVTSATESLKAGTAVAVTGGTLNAMLPSMTVTSFVCK